MPRKPKKPCSNPSCSKLVEGRFCDKHLKEYNRAYEKYERDPAIKKRYGRAWQKIRNKYINTNPICEECFKKNVFTKADEVHHILPLSKGGNHNEDNLMSLCKPCHSRISAKDGDRWRRRELGGY